MSFRSLFLLLIALFPFIVIAQNANDYQPGYYLTMQGDTVKGLIKYNWQNNSSRFPPKFKSGSNPALDYIELNANDVNEVFVDEAHRLISWPVSMSYGMTNVFLLRIADAGYDLFEFTGMDEKPGKLYFIRKDGESVIKRIDYQNLDKFISAVFADCPHVAQQARKYRYNATSMLSLINDVENCRGTSTVVQTLKQEKKKEKYLFAEGGYGFGEYSFPDYYKGIKNYKLSNYSLGIRLEGKSGKFAYGGGLYFEHSSGSYSNVVNIGGASAGRNLDISLNRIQLIPYVRYCQDFGKISILPEFGIVNNFHINSSFTDDKAVFFDMEGNPYGSFYDVKVYGIGIRPGISLSFPITQKISLQPGYRFIWMETEYDLVPNGFAASSDIYEIKHQFFVAVSIWKK